MMTIRLLDTYKNGNYTVKIYSNGTKFRICNKKEYLPVFPESIDLKITNNCDLGCLMCHEESNKDGEHAFLNHPFFETLERGTELAIGGGNPLNHPNLLYFLKKMKEKGVICNITINQVHLVKNLKFVQALIDTELVSGVGVSILNDKDLNKLIPFMEKNHNIVIHLIIGVVNEKLINKLIDHNFKILFLGYKQFGRGINYYSSKVETNIQYIKNNIHDIRNGFRILSFDNLAIDQLELRNKIPKDDLSIYYLGDDGEFTMYIDLVNKKFAKSSTEVKRYELLDDIKEMFKIVREGVKSGL